MDYQQIIEIAENKLGPSSKVVGELKECVSSGSTGGEISFMVGHYLIGLKQSDQPVFSLLSEEIKKYLEACEKNGLIISVP